MKSKDIAIFLIAVIMASLVYTPSILALEAVASLGKLKGDVDVLRQIGSRRESRKIPGRTGLILHDKDVVVTGTRSRVTIVFRDGSEIRLFQKTKFIIEKSIEAKKGSRRFFNNFRLSIGSFWGKFTKGRQRTKIKTPTATIGIKGTAVSMIQRNDQLDVSLSTGRISVENDDEVMELLPGKMIKEIQKEGSIKDKVSDLPYQVLLKPDRNKIKIPKRGDEDFIYFTLQIIDSETKKNVERAGSVYVSLELDKIKFGEGIALNSRGYARVRATILPFQKADYKNGQVEIFAIMDGENFMDVGAGKTVLTYDVPSNMSRTIRIDANSGNIFQ